jgi:FkbM family methyltransferase
VLWDVGAYIGTVAIRAMLDSRVREVHCFEPNPRTLEILRLNLSLNPGSSICHELALSDRTEHRMLADVSEINAGMATLAAEGETSGIRVRCMSVDDVISQGVAPPPDLLKIDVEDWEERLLQGAPVLLTTRPPRAIVLETAVASSGAMMSDQLHALLTEAGYAVSRIERPDGAVMERENFLAVHELSA